MELKFFTISNLYSLYKNKTLVFSADKKLEWDISAASAYIINLLGIGFTPNIVLHKKNGYYEVLDGYQRLKSLFTYIDRHCINGHNFKLHLNDSNNELHNIAFDQLSNYYKNALLEKELVAVLVNNLSEIDEHKIRELL